LPKLLLSLLAFGILTAASAGSFLGQAKGRSWRPWAHAATLAALSMIVLMYWPHRT
jgi:SRSO17 transposase